METPYLPRRWKDSQVKLSTANPYTVVAALSKDFKATVKKELDRSMGLNPEANLAGVLEELGVRGVGVASLLAMGHSQSRGAVGFYLGFKIAEIWEKAAEPEELRMALPLDAVNPILERLAQIDNSDDRKKADLLLISAIQREGEEMALTFCPIEIKNHAAKEEPHDFPESSDGVKDALKQLENSQKVITKVIDLLSTRPRAALVNSTMAALLETGAMLSKGIGGFEKTKLLQDTLTAVASGECAYFQGPSVLFWFEHFGRSKVGKPFKIRGCTAGSERAQLFMNPGELDLLHGQLPDPVNHLIRNLSDRGALFSDNPRPPLDLTKPTTEKPQQHKSEETSLSSSLESAAATPEAGSPEEQAPADAALHLSKIDRQVLESTYELIIDTLDQYKVSVLKPRGVEHILEGPATVVYRVKPDTGIRPSKIEAELDSLKLALGLQRDQCIRVDIDSGYVEITVPKSEKDRSFISTQQLWAMWARPETELEVPIGIDQRGKLHSLISSSQSPHLLIGGTTGSGKSEALNTILWGLLSHYSEQELRLLLIDPKGTELQEFEELPWVEGDLGIDAVDALEILDRAVREMDARYTKFAEAKVRKLADYITKVGPMPWWVIVLDEYADLTLEPEDKKAVEQRVKKLSAKLGRPVYTSSLLRKSRL